MRNITYDVPGNVQSTNDGYGHGSSVSMNASLNCNVPSTITVNGLSSSLTFNAMLQITGATGPNVDLQSIAYDTFGRPTMAQSPYGATEDTTYNIPAQTRTVRVRDSSMPQGYGTRFSRTTLDGLGRPVMVESGPMSGTVETVQSVVQMDYEPCACSPLGKVKRQSMAHALIAMRVWTEYDWDPVLGRRLCGARGTQVRRVMPSQIYLKFPDRSRKGMKPTVSFPWSFYILR